MTKTENTRVVYGLKSERLADETIVWHLMQGWKDDRSSFASWTSTLDTFVDHKAARTALKQTEGRLV